MMKKFSCYFLLSVFCAFTAFAEDPKFECPVNRLEGSELREANAQEAAMRAATIWRAVSSSLEPSIQWIQPFRRCMRVSGLPLENFVFDKKAFQRRIEKDFEKIAEEIRKEENPKIKFLELEEFEESKKEAKNILPSFDAEKKSIQFGVDEKRDIEQKKVEFEAKEKADCTDIDLAATLGPVRNQTDKGWCYAFSAADLVTFRLGPDTNKFTRRVSAADIAFQFNNENTSWFSKVFQGKDIGDEEGGWMDKALRTALKGGGFCLEKNAPSEGFAFGMLDQTIEEIRAVIDAPNVSADQFCFSYLRVQDMFPAIDLETYGEILAAAGRDNWEYFYQLNKRNCEGKRHTYDIRPEYVVNLKRRKDSKEALLAAIDHQISKKNILSIGFNSRMLGDTFNGGHAVNVVGRKYDEKSKTCRYLLRNSWGNGCSSRIHSNLCAKDHPGHLWVSKERLSKYLFDVTYIKP